MQKVISKLTIIFLTTFLQTAHGANAAWFSTCPKVMGTCDDSHAQSLQKMNGWIDNQKQLFAHNGLNAQKTLLNLWENHVDWLEHHMSDFPLILNMRSFLTHYTLPFSTEDPLLPNVLVLADILSIVHDYLHHILRIHPSNKTALDSLKEQTTALLQSHLAFPSNDILHAVFLIHEVHSHIGLDIKFIFQPHPEISGTDILISLSMGIALITFPFTFDTCHCPSDIIIKKGIIERFSAYIRAESVGRARRSTTHNIGPTTSFLQHRSTLLLDSIRRAHPESTTSPTLLFQYIKHGLSAITHLATAFSDHPFDYSMTFAGSIYDTMIDNPDYPIGPTNLQSIISNTAIMADIASSVPIDGVKIKPEFGQPAAQLSALFRRRCSILEDFVKNSQRPSYPPYTPLHEPTFPLDTSTRFAQLAWLNNDAESPINFNVFGHILSKITRDTGQRMASPQGIGQTTHIFLLLTSDTVCTPVVSQDHTFFAITLPKPSALLAISNLTDFIRFIIPIQNLYIWLAQGATPGAIELFSERCHKQTLQEYLTLQAYEHHTHTTTASITIINNRAAQYEAFIGAQRHLLPEQTIRNWQLYKKQFNMQHTQNCEI